MRYIGIELFLGELRKMFTTAEAMTLTGLTRNQLSHLARIELVVPKPVSTRQNVYDWRQLKELRFIAEIRKTLSLQQIRQAAKSLSEMNFDDGYLYSQKIVIFENSLVLIDRDNDSYGLTISGKYKNQRIMNVFACNEILDNLVKLGREKVAYFDAKIKEDCELKSA
jgi:DNA-binding transcriptional MerR regulator